MVTKKSNRLMQEVFDAIQSFDAYLLEELEPLQKKYPFARIYIKRRENAFIYNNCSPLNYVCGTAQPKYEIEHENNRVKYAMKLASKNVSFGYVIKGNKVTFVKITNSDLGTTISYDLTSTEKAFASEIINIPLPRN